MPTHAFTVQKLADAAGVGVEAVRYCQRREGAGMTRTFRQTVCRMLIGVVLFAQMAVSAYACPAMSMATAASAQAADCATMAMGDASEERAGGTPAFRDRIDVDAPNLCAAHCHFGQQTAEDSTAPAIPGPALMTSFYAVPLPTAPLGTVRPAAEAPDRFAAAFPPHAILHCCFRI